MKRDDIISRWQGFAARCGGALSEAHVYWAGSTPRHWSLPVGGHDIDPTKTYVYLHHTPNHCRIVFTIVDGFQLASLEAGMVDASTINTDYRQCYLEYSL